MSTSSRTLLPQSSVRLRAHPENSLRALKNENDSDISSERRARIVRKNSRYEGEIQHEETPAQSRSSSLTLRRRISSGDQEFGVLDAEQALRDAANSSNDEEVALALRELGKAQMAAGRVEDALRTLSKFLAVAKRIPDPEGICDAHMELVFAHKALENTEGTIKHLDALRRCATRHKLSYKLAQAHYYTGEYLLNKSQAHLATPHLELALEQFRSLEKNAEAKRARCAAGISKGQEVMQSYVDLVAGCRPDNAEAIIKMCNWKNDRVPFWSA